MKNFMKGLVAALMVVSFSTAAMAEESNYVETSGLTAEQKAELQLQVAKLKSGASDPAKVSENVRKEAEAWGDLGSNMGKAVDSVAKEVGVAANEFAQTPLGKITVAVVVFKVIGTQAMHLIFGSLILLMGWTMSLYLLAFARFYNKDTTYEYKPFLWGAWQRRVRTSFNEEGEATAIRLLMVGVVFVVTTMWGTGTIFL